MAEVEEQFKTEDNEVSLIGQKRQNTEGGGPTSKKANLPESDNLLIKVLIPSAAADALIGKGGETLRNLNNESGCRVQMSKNQQDVHPGTTERVCTVKGKIASTMIVMSAILEKIQEKIEATHPTDPFDLKGLDRTKEMKFVVSNNIQFGKKEAAIIGKLQGTTTANIQIYPKVGSEEAKKAVERVITVGHETNEVLLNAVQYVLEEVGQDLLHALLTSPSIDFGESRLSTGSSQIGGIGELGTSSDSMIGKSFGGGSSSKFNPLQGTGNNELLAFLDKLRSTLRTSGFNDQSVSEVTDAIQVLAKHNVMGLGLGLDMLKFAATAQTKKTESALGQRDAQNSSSSLQQQHQQRYDQSNLMSGGGGGSMLDSQGNPDQKQRLLPCELLNELLLCLSRRQQNYRFSELLLSTSSVVCRLLLRNKSFRRWRQQAAAVGRYRLFPGRVLIELFPEQQKTKGGIMIPAEKAQGKVLEGTVMSVGPECKMQLKVGDRVLLPEYGGFKMPIEDKEYHIFRESDILGKVE